jgi:hypothetical protein
MGKIVQVYSGSGVTVVFGPVNSGMGGQETDEFIRISQEGDDVIEEYDLNGNVVLSPNEAIKFTAVWTVKQSSPINDMLSAILALQKTPGMAGSIHPMMIKDTQGTTIYQAANAWIRKAPDDTRGQKIGKMEWTFGLSGLTRFSGGNTIVTS